MFRRFVWLREFFWGFSSIVLTCLVVAQANAYEVIDVCVEFVDMGQKYKVEAQVYAGYELIRQTGDRGYNRLDNYAVIFWHQGTSSVIELESLVGNRISQFGSEGTEQNGYGWIVRRRHGFCAC